MSPVCCKLCGTEVEPNLTEHVDSDGTLLTNRYHFAIQDGPLKGKGGLVGWFGSVQSNTVLSLK